MVDEQPHFSFCPIQPGDRQVGLAQRCAGDGKRVDRVAHAVAAGVVSRVCHQLRWHPDDPLARSEQVALTLGCTRSQAFWMVVLPEARRGLLTAATLAWARSLGEFGPILIFSGATRMKTEVLSTTVFLELSVGNIEAAVAVSLLMIGASILVLLLVRFFGSRTAMEKWVKP